MRKLIEDILANAETRAKLLDQVVFTEQDKNKIKALVESLRIKYLKMRTQIIRLDESKI